MKFLSKIVILFFSNFVGIFLANYFVSGFQINTSIEAIIKVVGIFTLINLFIRPVLKFVLSPIIFITFGLGIIVVNAITLYLLDLLSTDISISGLYPLIYATLIIGVINLIIGFSSKKLSDKEN